MRCMVKCKFCTFLLEIHFSKPFSTSSFPWIDSSGAIDHPVQAKTGECLALGQLTLDKNFYHSGANAIYQESVASRAAISSACSIDASTSYITSTECQAAVNMRSVSQPIKDQPGTTGNSANCAHLPGNVCYAANTYSSSHNLLDENGVYLPSPYAATRLLCTSNGHILNDANSSKPYDTPNVNANCYGSKCIANNVGQSANSNTFAAGRGHIISIRATNGGVESKNVYDIPQQRQHNAQSTVRTSMKIFFNWESDSQEPCD